MHIYRHFLYEGVGLRQLLDYYFVLKAAQGRYFEETVSTLKEFGMIRFARGVMWIMKNIFLLEPEYLLCAPDEKEGRYILEADIIEKIDIGGISLIRAGAKNFNDVVIVPSKAEYGVLLDILNKQGAETTLAQRKDFAARAFGVSSHYDTAIHGWFVR